jgi:hypothetical protein
MAFYRSLSKVRCRERKGIQLSFVLIVLNQGESRMAFYRRVGQSKAQRTQRDSAKFCPHFFEPGRISHGFLPQSLAKYGAEERKGIQLSFVLIFLNQGESRMAFYRRVWQSKAQRTQRDSAKFCPHFFEPGRISYGFLPQSWAK